MAKHLKKLLSGLLVSAVVFASSAVPSFASNFADVPDGFWAETQINFWTGAGVLHGDSGIGGNYRPNDPLKKAEFASILNQLMKYVNTTSEKLGDVAADDGYQGAIRKLIASGILVPTAGAKNVNPGEFLTRGEMIVMLAKAFDVKPVSGKTAFLDDAAIPAAQKKYLKGLLESGWNITGYGEKDGVVGGFEFRAAKRLTRAEVLTFVNYGVARYVNKAGTITGGTVDGNMLINCSGVTLNGVTINGDLYIAEGVDLGTINLTGVTVKGRIIVHGGGNTATTGVFITDSKIGSIWALKYDGEVNIVLRNSSVETLSIGHGANVTNIGSTIGTVCVATTTTITDGQKVSLTGDYTTVITDDYYRIFGEVANKPMDSLTINGNIVTLTENEPINVHGKGNIEVVDGSAKRGTDYTLDPTITTGKKGGSTVTNPSTTPVPGTSIPGGGGVPAVPGATATPTAVPGATATPTAVPGATATPTPAPTVSSVAIEQRTAVSPAETWADVSTLTLKVGDADITLRGVVTMSDATTTTSVTWSTTDSSVVTVTNGVLHVVGVGSATVEATSTADSTKSDTLTVTVGHNVTVTLSISANPADNGERTLTILYDGSLAASGTIAVAGRSALSFTGGTQRYYGGSTYVAVGAACVVVIGGVTYNVTIQ